MQEKIKVMKKQIPNSSNSFLFRKRIPFKNPHRLPTEPMGIHHSPHTHTIPIPMGIPIPTAALPVSSSPLLPCIKCLALAIALLIRVRLVTSSALIYTSIHADISLGSCATYYSCKKLSKMCSQPFWWFSRQNTQTLDKTENVISIFGEDKT